VHEATLRGGRRASPAPYCNRRGPTGRRG
jgi:hypothetical protein